LGRSHSGNKIFDSAMILHPWCALHAATNINSVRRNRSDGLPDVLVGQAAGENEESREGTDCSCGSPITCQAGSATEVGMMRVNQNVAISKQRDLFSSELRIHRERPDYTKFAS
jgi:hypothetical protein